MRGRNGKGRGREEESEEEMKEGMKGENYDSILTWPTVDKQRK